MSDVHVSPSELTFKFEPRKAIPVTMTLTNTTTERVAFKVKTTSPKKYCVRPSSGFVEPNSTREVQVIMQASREAPVSYEDCKDKFLVQTVKVPAGVSEVTTELFDPSNKSREVKQTKLKVVLIPPAKPPSPVPEGNEEPVSPSDSYQNRKSSFDTRMAHLQQPRGAAATKVSRSPRAGYGLISVLLVAMLAFLIGQFGGVALPIIQEKFAELQGQLHELINKHIK